MFNISILICYRNVAFLCRRIRKMQVVVFRWTIISIVKRATSKCFAISQTALFSADWCIRRRLCRNLRLILAINRQDLLTFRTIWIYFFDFSSIRTYFSPDFFLFFFSHANKVFVRTCTLMLNTQVFIFIVVGLILIIHHNKRLYLLKPNEKLTLNLY